MPGVPGVNAERERALFYAEGRKERKYTKFNAGCGWCERRGGVGLLHLEMGMEEIIYYLIYHELAY